MVNQDIYIDFRKIYLFVQFSYENATERIINMFYNSFKLQKKTFNLVLCVTIL